MAEPRITPKQLILGGIAAILFGILYQLGADIYNYAKAWLFSTTLDFHFVISIFSVVLGIAFVLIGVLMLRNPILNRKAVELVILREAQGYYPSPAPTLSISRLIKLKHQTVLGICRDLGKRELLEVKEMNGHALVRITSRGQKVLQEVG
jgi:hypothetical protein